MTALVLAVLNQKARSAEIKTVMGANESDDTEEQKALPAATRKKLSLAVFICEIAAFVATVVAFFIPLYSAKGASVDVTVPVKALTSGAPIGITVVFAVMIIVLFAEILCLASNVSDWLRGAKTYVKSAGRFIIGTAVFTLVFFVAGYCFAFWFNIHDPDTKHYSIAFIPLIISTVVLIVNSIFGGKLRVGEPVAPQNRKFSKIEPLIAEIVITAVTFISLALNIVVITREYPIGDIRVVQHVALSGYKLLSEYKSLAGGFQVLAFLEAAVLLVSGILLVVSLIGFFAKDKSFYKMVKAAVVANFLFVLLMGLFGFYFKIAQKINLENIKSLLEYYEISIADDSYVYDVASQTIYMLIASFGVVAWMVARGLFGLGAEKQVESAGGDTSAKPDKSEIAETAAAAATLSAEQPAFDFDACPAFTELDGQIPQLSAELNERRAHLFDSPSLPNIVRFVVDYARECRLHLSYSVEDMANFVAGLGASRLTILQGMSGTGKTSLPKIFTEAIMGKCEIVEVESSWRDKNELLGYYNEFSKCYTPKKFTRVLYRARLNSSVLTFIVLDEMNLSRIEYYFSDFLSLMENEEDKREIKLSNVKLFRTENGQKIPYAGLTDGHTVKIPRNVWFIGTANRDESTFEISDKVYDRAQTMNFNKRAPKIYTFGDPLGARFVPYDMLLNLFDEAKASYNFDAENNAAIQKAEKLLAPYNISFGNRVLRQIEDFVKIYCAYFGDKAAAERDAVERILLSKVVSKLENKIVENKEALAVEFDKLGLKECGAFIRRLSED